MKISVDKLVRSKRRTIALIVEGDGSFTVRAPTPSPYEFRKAFAIEPLRGAMRSGMPSSSYVN